jgi:hypothetical protein
MLCGFFRIGCGSDRIAVGPYPIHSEPTPDLHLAVICRMRCPTTRFRMLCGLFRIGCNVGKLGAGPYPTLSNPMSIPGLADTCRLRRYRIRFRMLCRLFWLRCNFDRTGAGPSPPRPDLRSTPYLAVTCRMRRYKARCSLSIILASSLKNSFPDPSPANSNLSIHSASSLENAFPVPAPEPDPACQSSSQAASRTPAQLQLQNQFQPVHPLRRQPREFLPKFSSRASSRLSILFAGSLENDLPDPAPGCPSSSQAASRMPSQMQLQSPFQPVHPLRRQPRESLPRSSSRARSSLFILSAGSLENSFPDPAPEPAPACPSSSQAASRLPSQIQLQSRFQPVHPLSRQPPDFLPISSSRARSSLSILSAGSLENFFTDPAPEPVPACLSSSQAASRIPSQIQLQSQF